MLNLSGGLWPPLFIVEKIMKQLNFNLFLFRFALLFALGLTALQVEANADEADQVTTAVHYDRQNDHLTVTAKAASLKSVLGRLAQQSGIEVLFDDKADEQVSINIQTDSLEDGLKHILKGSNHMLRYSRDDKEKLLLVGVVVLPVGEQDSSGAKRLIGIDSEAYHRARAELTHQQVQKMDKAGERWQARLNEMPDERRKALEKRVNERLLKKTKHDQERAEMLAKEKQLAAEEKAKELATREKALKRLDPDQRTVFEQRSAESREKMRLLLQKK